MFLFVFELIVGLKAFERHLSNNLGLHDQTALKPMLNTTILIFILVIVTLTLSNQTKTL